MLKIPGISDRVLTERLRDLGEHGIVERLVEPGPPIKVIYRLTPQGMGLQPVIEAVERWVERWSIPDEEPRWSPTEAQAL